MFPEYEEVKPQLDSFDLSHYGFGHYLAKGFVSPGHSLIAPSICFDQGYGDCDTIGVHLAKILFDHGVPSQRLGAWFVNIPLLLPDGDRAAMQHTIPIVIDGNKTYLLGFTPYDFIVNGRIGVFEKDEYGAGAPIRLRHTMDWEEHRRALFTQRLRLAYLTQDGSGLSIAEIDDNFINMTSGLSWPNREGMKVISLSMICQADTRCPVGWHQDEGVFVEMSVLRGETPNGYILGFRVDICMDVFNQTKKALQTVARHRVFLVLPTSRLPELRKVITGWEPKTTLGRLLSDDRPNFIEVRVEEDQNPAQLEGALMSCGDELYHAILHTYAEAYGANDIRARDVYRAITS